MHNEICLCFYQPCKHEAKMRQNEVEFETIYLFDVKISEAGEGKKMYIIVFKSGGKVTDTRLFSTISGF